MGAGESEAALARVGASPLFEVGAAIESEALAAGISGLWLQRAPARSKTAPIPLNHAVFRVGPMDLLSTDNAGESSYPVVKT